MTDGEKLALFMRIEGLTNSKAGERFGVYEKTISNWKSGKYRVPESVLEIIDGCNKGGGLQSAIEGLQQIVYKLIQNQMQIELELTSLRRYAKNNHEFSILSGHKTGSLDL